MKNQLRVRLPTDQLWNRKNAEQRYGELVSSASPAKTYNSESDIPSISYVNEKGEEDSFLTDTKRHQLTNVRDIECSVDNRKVHVYVRGIGLFEEQPDGFRLSSRGKRLREAYTDRDNDTSADSWRNVLAEIVVQRFLRIRTLLFYLGRGLGLSYSGSRLFTGNQLLVNSNISYSVYRTELRDISGTYNGYLTFYGLKSKLQSALDDSEKDLSLEWLDKLYGLEYAIVESAFESHEFIVTDLELLKQRIFEQIRSNSIDRLLIEDIEQSASGLLDSVTEVPSAGHSYKKVPNLLLGANVADILGDEIWAEIESAAETDQSEFSKFELTGRSSDEEPLGGNIIATTRHAQRLLEKVGALTDASEHTEVDILPDVNWFHSHIGTEPTNKLLPDVLEDARAAFTDDLKQGIAETTSGEGWVKWQDLKDNVCSKRGISETEFDNKADSLIKDGRLLIQDTKMGIRSSPEGPPGYRNKPKVQIELE